jgi:AcrR family transcriptional regulator
MARSFESSIDHLIEARSEANPGAKLLAAARDLFNEQGYANAGINEIIARSSTSKKSFYHYYPGKAELGKAYLLAEEKDMADLLGRLFENHPRSYRAFVKAWVKTLRHFSRKKGYSGCPFANAAAHAHEDFADLLTEIMGRMQGRLQKYLITCDLALRPARAAAVAQLVLVQYEGTVQMWRLTGDDSYLDILETSLLKLAV